VASDRVEEGSRRPPRHPGRGHLARRPALRELALEFTGRVGELELQGIDLISLDERLHIRSLDVMIRPINAVLSLREIIAPRMASFLAERGAPSASR